MPLGMLGKYERLDVLGHGASGIVYLAQDTLLKRRVALKEISASGEERQKVLEEARVLDRLRHPNIVAVHGVDTIDGKIVIDMEYVPGRNLLEILRQADGPLPVADSLLIASQICEGLAYAHVHRTIHRDIKPANILVSQDLHVKLADFGLAQVLGTNSYAGGAGTYAYMAPEDFEESHQSDEQSDIWSVGIILYEMLTGNRPFSVVNAKDPFAWGRAVNKETIPPPSHTRPGIPATLDRICLHALQRLKSDRYSDAADMAEDLKLLESDLPARTPLRAPEAVYQREETSSPQSPAVQTLAGASSLDEFLKISPNRWEEACAALEDGELGPWLEAIQEPLLARVALQLTSDISVDREARMRDFLYRAGVELEETAKRDADTAADLLKQGGAAQALPLLLRSVRLDPNHPSYFRMLAHAQLALGDQAGARLTLERGVEGHPNDRGIRRYLAQLGGNLPQASISQVDFGILRAGQARSYPFFLRAAGQQSVDGRISSLPTWVSVTPITFSGKSRQIFRVEAHTEFLAREPAEYEDVIVIQTSNGQLAIPVKVTIAARRPTFRQIFFWYLPMTACCLLPLLFGEYATVESSHRGDTIPLYLAGLISSGTLFLAFIAVNLLAETRVRERSGAILGAFLAPIGLLATWTMNQQSPSRLAEAWPAIVGASMPSVVLLMLQGVALTRFREQWGRWPLWCGLISLVSLVVCAVLWIAGARVQ